MPDVIEIEKAPEVVIPLSAMLETPNELEEAEKTAADTKVETGEVKVAEAEVKVEQAIEDAKADGASKEELNELRGLLRELRNDNISLKARLSAAERVQKGDFGTDGKKEEVTELEFYQSKLVEAAQKDFSQILAVMEVNPKYEDIASVCSVSNFNDIFEKVAQYRVSENGGDFSTELVKVKAEIWSLSNPYKYMYETIKEYHPKYITKTEPVKESASAKDVLAKESKKVVTAPGSVANMGSGDETKGGWTSEKIDSMPENELHKVPRDIYNKWLSGSLG
jgi:hypothetical protein